LIEETVKVDGIKICIITHQGDDVPENQTIKPTYVEGYYLFFHSFFREPIVGNKDSIMEITYSA